ncbi:MAG TPA: hypothetical protein VGZ02_17805 [Candidatus Baltobacteraceae bacterium]|jgi:ATP/maltotriose-dependent transcriptional regulator MalT|nr:hypothetical protein [Candidatus Baltobacteraceae bacterium]
MALLARPRILESLLDATSGATLLTAGSGFGKSVAVRQFLAATTRQAVHYEVRASSKTFVPFVRGFVDAAARAIPGLQTTFPGAIEFAMQSPKPYEEIAVWLLDHLGGATVEVIAIEDAHHPGGDEQVRLLLARLVQSSVPKVRWIFTSRDVESVPLQEVANAGVRVSRVDAEQLRFTRAEAEIVARDAGLSRELVDVLYSLTHGWPAAFHLGAHVFDGGRIPPDSAYAFFAQAYFVRCREDVQSLLMGSAVLSDIDEELLAQSPWASCLEHVRELAKNGLVFTPRAGGRYVFHELFRKFLLDRIGPVGSGGRRSAMMYAASLLERCGRFADALNLFEYSQDVPNVVRLCVEHGFELIDKGQGDVVRRAIALIGDSYLHRDATLMALQAIEESQAGRHDTAESWYLHALKRSENTELRATIAYRYALDLIRQGRTKSIDLLEPYVDENGLTHELAASIFSALATAYVVAGRFDDARKTISRAVRLLAFADTRASQAKICQHAAWVNLFTGDIAAAKRFGSQSVEHALASGLYDVAARAYSVLHNVACEVEYDTDATIDFLNKIWDCGLKCGEPKLRLYALLGSFDIAVERGDIEAVLRIERTLEAYEVDFADPMIDSALLPAQALRLAACGDFEEAYRLLASTGERQTSQDRGALRFAEVALYAAASGNFEAAMPAARESQKLLRGVDPSPRASRTSAVLSVAFYLMGHHAEAKLLLRGIPANSGVSSRAQVLVHALEVIFGRWEGHCRYLAVLEALEALKNSDFGGIAAVLAALPAEIAVSA